MVLLVVQRHSGLIDLSRQRFHTKKKRGQNRPRFAYSASVVNYFEMTKLRVILIPSPSSSSMYAPG
jgi:hypothetical protein